MPDFGRARLLLAYEGSRRLAVTFRIKQEVVRPVVPVLRSPPGTRDRARDARLNFCRRRVKTDPRARPPGGQFSVALTISTLSDSPESGALTKRGSTSRSRGGQGPGRASDRGWRGRAAAAIERLLSERLAVKKVVHRLRQLGTDGYERDDASGGFGTTGECRRRGGVMASPPTVVTSRRREHELLRSWQGMATDIGRDRLGRRHKSGVCGASCELHHPVVVSRWGSQLEAARSAA